MAAFLNINRCQHIKMNGIQCGSPALRRRRHCFFHRRAYVQNAKIEADFFATGRFGLPILEDANSVQLALMHVLQLLALDRIEPKRAGLLLYGLQTASANLRNANFEPDKMTDVVIDQDDVARTAMGGPQWFEEDYRQEEKEEEEEEEEGKQEEAKDYQEDYQEDHDEDAEGDDLGEVAAKAEPEAQTTPEEIRTAEPRKPVRGVADDFMVERAAARGISTLAGRIDQDRTGTAQSP